MKNFLNNSFKKLVTQSFPIWIISVLFLLGFLLFNEKFEVIISLIAISAVLIFIDKITHLGYLLILLVPLSIGVTLPGGLHISLPSEGLIILLITISGLKVLNGLKLEIPIYTHPLSILLLLDLSWGLITSLTSEIPIVSIKRFLIKMLFITCFFYLIPALMKAVNGYKNLLFLYGVGLILPIISTTYNHLQLGLSQENSLQVSLPFFDEHTVYAACITFLIPFFSFQIFKVSKFRFLNIAILGLLFVGFFLSYSRASWLSLGVAIIVLVLIRIKVSIWILITSSILIGCIVLLNFSSVLKKLENSSSKYNDDISTHFVSVTNLKDDASNLERINRWVCAFRMFKDRPLQGYGPGTYQFVYDRFQTTEFMTRISTNTGNNGNAHSEYLMVLSESGLPGFLILIGWVISSYYFAVTSYFASSSKQNKQLLLSIIIGLTTFYTHGIFNSFIDSNKMALLVYGSLGIITCLHQEIKNNELMRL
ncbi:MAG: putative inorganic carbon (HCO3(-)) transporter [Salibacteraceae bacterium]|jgi:putative inorganic carbon (HCO3(-)) transporter